MSGISRSDREMLEEFGLLAAEDLATLLGIGVKSLHHRPRDQLPESVKVGRRRFYKEASVRQWLGLPEKTATKAAPASGARAPTRRRNALQPLLADLRRIEDQLGMLQVSETVSDAGARYMRFASFSVAQAVAALEAASE